MIDELHVRDVALIREARLSFAEGLTVITGETGSGKTALLSALKLLVGERAGQSMVREGAKCAQVEGRFFLDEVPPALRDVVGEEVLEEGCVVSRRLDARGRSRVTIDGAMGSVRLLAEGPGSTVELCGQHENQRLLHRSEHLALVDAMADSELDEALGRWREALEEARAATADLTRLEELSRETGERLDQARFTLDRIDEVAPRPGELEGLEADLPRAEHAESLLSAAMGSRELLVGDEGAQDALGEVVRTLRSAGAMDPALVEVASQVESALVEVEDVAETLRSYADSVDLDPAELQRMQERHATLQGLMRRFGPTMADVLALRARAAELVALAEGSDDRLAEARERRDRAEERLSRLAEELDALRDKAIPVLEAAVAEQLSRLEMGGARVTVRRERLGRERWAETGPSQVELLYRAGEGLTARPLAKVASGGEISRIMLALKVVMGEADQVETLVFDEVDAGVGGTTAVALAQVLRDLARTHQVICVTHLPQVAVMGDAHYVLTKIPGEPPESHLEPVEGEERVAEVARMLAGEESATSLAHAAELLGATPRRG